MAPRTTAIVVGGGPSGLLAAAHLAEAGMSTTLLEAKAGFGGRAATQRRDGLFLNQGPHALYLGGAAKRELNALAIDPPGWRRDAGQIYIRDGVLRSEVEHPDALRRWFESVASGRCGERLARTSVSEWLDRSLDGAGREAAAAFVRLTTLVADHDHFSADAAAMQLQNALRHGVRYVRGWLADARRCDRWGGAAPRRDAAHARRGSDTGGAVRGLDGVARRRAASRRRRDRSHRGTAGNGALTR